MRKISSRYLTLLVVSVLPFTFVACAGPADEEPSTAVEYINLSLEHYTQGEYQECIEACNKALKIDPNSSIAYNNICSSYLQMGEYDKAIEACEKALALKPDYERAKNNLRAARRKKQSGAP